MECRDCNRMESVTIQLDITSTTLNLDHIEENDMCNVVPHFYPDLVQLSWVQTTFIVLYSLVIFLSLVGNIMVIWTLWKHKHMRTVTNYYILNLAVSDLLVATFVMPLKLLEYTAPCSWGVFAHDGLCLAVYFVLPVFVFVSVFTLMAISLER